MARPYDWLNAEALDFISDGVDIIRTCTCGCGGGDGGRGDGGHGSLSRSIE